MSRSLSNSASLAAAAAGDMVGRSRSSSSALRVSSSVTIWRGFKSRGGYGLGVAAPGSAAAANAVSATVAKNGRSFITGGEYGSLDPFFQKRHTLFDE